MKLAMWYQNTAPHTREKAGRAACEAQYPVSARWFPAGYGVERAKAAVFVGLPRQLRSLRRMKSWRLPVRSLNRIVTAGISTPKGRPSTARTLMRAEG